MVPVLQFAVSEAEFSWGGELTESVFNSCHALIFARGFLWLGLLTHEIEATLSVLMADNTAHERMEWTLEYEARTGSL